MRALVLLTMLSGCWREQRDVRDAHDIKSEQAEKTDTLTGTEALAADSVTETVTERSHAKGALQGLGLGVLIGGGLGAAAGYAGGDDHDCGESAILCVDFSAEEKAVFAGIGGAAVGGLLGLFIGGVVGSETVIEQRKTRITPVAPRGSTAGFTVTF
jgi:outer membrane lipoprotein SlyB